MLITFLKFHLCIDLYYVVILKVIVNKVFMVQQGGGCQNIRNSSDHHQMWLFSFYLTMVGVSNFTVLIILLHHSTI